MIAPQNLHGDPILIDDENLSANTEDDDHIMLQYGKAQEEEQVSTPILPLRRFRFLPRERKLVENDKRQTERRMTSIEDEDFEFQQECSGHGLVLVIKAYESLAPTDALALLLGEDNTGMMVWQGSARLSQYIVDQYHTLLRSIQGDISFTAECESRERDHQARSDRAKTADDFHSSFAETSPINVTVTEDLQNVDTVVELGCGSGILGLVAGFTFEAKSILLTDGNNESVQLAQSNFDRNRQVFISKKELARDIVMIGKAKQFQWRNLSFSEASDLLFAHRESVQLKRNSTICVVGADIVYDLDSIPLLVDAVHSLATTFAEVRDKQGIQQQGRKARAHFWLCFHPRQCSTQDSERMLNNVISILRSKEWDIFSQSGDGGENGNVIHFTL